MAIIKKLRASITSGGKTLREYPCPSDEVSDKSDEDLHLNRNCAVKYIEASANSNFKVDLKIDRGFKFGQANYVSFLVRIDGRRVRGKVCPITDYYKNGGWTRTYEGATCKEDGQWKRQLLKWNSLPTVDEKCTKDEAKKYAKMGTIRVEVWRMRGGAKAKSQRSLQLGTDEPVPAKAVVEQAVDLCADLGEAQPSPKVSTWSGKAIDAEACAVFIFKYRSREALQKLSIVRRPKIPVSLEERPVESLTKKELVELVRRTKAAEEEHKVKIKMEKAESNLAQLADLKRDRDELDGGDDDEVEFLVERPRKQVCVVGGVIE